MSNVTSANKTIQLEFPGDWFERNTLLTLQQNLTTETMNHMAKIKVPEYIQTETVFSSLRWCSWHFPSSKARSSHAFSLHTVVTFFGNHVDLNTHRHTLRHTLQQLQSRLTGHWLTQHMELPVTLTEWSQLTVQRCPTSLHTHHPLKSSSESSLYLGCHSLCEQRNLSGLIRVKHYLLIIVETQHEQTDPKLIWFLNILWHKSKHFITIFSSFWPILSTQQIHLDTDI